ncbi:MAG: leucine-rich repeat protein [Clostridia bacterium]|nr:leucine-rich repeat protein [Clostridia bacterium]
MNKTAAAVIASVLIAALLIPASAEWGEDEIWDGLCSLSLWVDAPDHRRTAPGDQEAFAVYSAPFEDAWQNDFGGAEILSGENFNLLGSAEEGKWSMIEYGVPGGGNRVGWARLPGMGYRGWDNFPADDARPCTLRRDAELTDDPRGKKRTVTTLSEGDRVKALGVWNTWAYVQTDMDGKTAWLFVPLDALEIERLWSVDENGILTLRGSVTRAGGSRLGTEYLDDDERREFTVPLSKDEITVPGLAYGDNLPISVKAVDFPSSLRYLGSEALSYGEYAWIRLGGDPVSKQDIFYAVRTRRMILSAECSSVDAILNSEYVEIGAWEVEEGNPYFKSVDGVLFSADGKKLISYPGGSTEEHYTVPAGTEEICTRAFDDDMMDIPLKTVSLPIGLKRIGEYAFSGCGRLISLAVPLTVTDIADTAFACCVSLERLSLPPGMGNFSAGKWVDRPDLTRYNGDNGGPGTGETEDDDIWFSARLDTPDGLGTVPWYASPTEREPAGETPAGTGVIITSLSEGRAGTDDWDDEGGLSTRWYSVNDLRPGSGETFFKWTYTGDGLRIWTGDTRILGILEALSPLAPIPILDAPDGSETAHAFGGEQAEVLDRQGPWLRIRTAESGGWIREENFTLVPQADR